MSKRFSISILAAALALSAFAWPLVWASTQASRPEPSEEEMSIRTKNLIANQHADDLAQDRYERIERHVDETGGSNPRILEDKTIRVVPNGAGTTKLLVIDNGKSADPAEFRRQLESLVQVLQMMVNPNDPRAKTATAKYQKHFGERSQLVDSVTNAFTLEWRGQESKSGRDCDVVLAKPNPNFHAHTIFQEALVHVSAKVWVDRSSDQIVHVDAQVLSDISFGGGLLGKLYRGGTFTLDQDAVAPGIWFPTREEYDYSGRKLLFPFEEHQFIEFSHYRLVGPPKEALALIKAELADGKLASGDP